MIIAPITNILNGNNYLIDMLIGNLFYLFSALIIISALLVISATNPIHSVLFLIVVFCNAAALLILLEVEFLSMIFLVVYVGAIAVLFLFVVMMLNIKLTEFNQNLLIYLPIGMIIAFIFVFEIFLIIDTDLVPLFSYNFADQLQYINWVTKINTSTNIGRLGEVIYTDYFYLLLVAGMILLVAMIGAIVLTLYRDYNIKRQDIYKQISRDFNKTIYLQN